MNGWWPAAVDVSSVSQHARESRGTAEAAACLMAALGVIGLSWLVLFLWDRYRRELHRIANDPRTLFHELCRSHGLNRGERRLLWKAAVRYRLDHPALVFAIPHYVHELAGSSGPHGRAYAGLAVRLFGSATADVSAPPAAGAGSAEPVPAARASGT
jgi:hypothetical protein